MDPSSITFKFSSKLFQNIVEYGKKEDLKVSVLQEKVSMRSEFRRLYLLLEQANSALQLICNIVYIDKK